MGLVHIHNCKIIHTDLKPENILMLRTPKIIRTLSKAQLDELKTCEPNSSNTERDVPELQQTSDKPQPIQPIDNHDNKEDHTIQAVPIEPVVKLKATKPSTEERRKQSGLPYNHQQLEQVYGADQSYRIKIVDLGNACWVHKHFTTDVQTREYRAPEVIIGATYGPAIDVWSVACIVFELLTGDQLFKPKSGSSYGKSDDHLALIMELLGRPKAHLLQGKFASDYFNRKGELKQIKKLKFWGLKEVLADKYHLSDTDSTAISSFLLPMLSFDSRLRATAEDSLKHEWIQAIDINSLATAFH